MKPLFHLLILIAFAIPFSIAYTSSGSMLFQEDFEDANFASRGWYDNTNIQLSSTEHVSGSTNSAEFHFLIGATKPTSGGSTRMKFADTDEVYVSYYVKYSSNYEGSNRAYHPHEFYLLTNEDGDWEGPAFNYLTAYIEHNEGVPVLSIQDGKNIDLANINVDLINVTEQRAVAGCNGNGNDGYDSVSCYPVGGGYYWNGKVWKAGSIYFSDNPGQYYKNDWHFVEAYFKLNSIASGIGVADGQLKYWYDGNLIIDHNNVIMRTGQHPNMKFNQFLIAPWIGDGSPVDQTFWVDNLTVETSRSQDTTAPIVSNGSPTGTLASGTTQTTLSVTTNENATCGYSTSSGTAYASATPFTITGGVTGHSETITGLSDGSTYNYYVRCEDSLFNANTSDYTITFDVSSGGGGDTTPPVISGGSPTGTLASGTTQTTLSVITDENATCGYSTSSGTPYASMTQFTTTGGVTSHSETISSLSDGSTYNYYVRCEDSLFNTNTTDYTITFDVSSGGGSPTIMTFYPTSADGYVYSTGASFTSARNAAVGITVDDTSVNSRVSVGESGNYMARAFFSFDTSALPDDAVITDATLNLYVYQKNNNDNDGDDWINIVQGNQNSPTALTTDDFDQAGAINNPVEGATRVDITTITTGQYTAWILDATGLSWISVNGHTMLALREGHDAIDSVPTSYNRIKFYTSEQTGTSQDPYLSITYNTSPAPAAPTGLKIVP